MENIKTVCFRGNHMKNFVYAAIAFIGLGNSQTYTIDTQSIKEAIASVKSTVTNGAKTTYQKNKALCHIVAGLGLFCVTIAILPAYGLLCSSINDISCSKNTGCSFYYCYNNRISLFWLQKSFNRA